MLAGQQEFDRLVDLAEGCQRLGGKARELEVTGSSVWMKIGSGNSAARLVLPMPGTP
jgi:hypothetical protein